MLVVFIIFVTFVACYIPLRGDIAFWSDNARDLMLLEDLVTRQPIQLIGPRSGISGMFHGPLWMYLNVPAYLLGNGNPAVIGLFWVAFFISSLFIMYMVTQKLFKNNTQSLAAVLLFDFYYATNVPSLFNPFGAVVVFPLFFYFFYEYVRTKKVKFLAVSFFLLGLVIQFQAAFGGPLLVLTLLFLIPFLIKNKKLLHLLASASIIVPLSTYIVFELKHNFLQTSAFLSYIKAPHGPLDIPFFIAKLAYIFRIEFLQTPYWLSALLLAALFFTACTIKKFKKLYLLALYFYFGYWIIVLPYRGVMWPFYYWPLWPTMIMVFVSFLFHLAWRNIGLILLFGLITYKTVGVYNDFKRLNMGWVGENIVSWQFYNLALEQVYTDARGDFGFFVIAGDQIGYPPRYAVTYVGKRHSAQKAYIGEKRTKTYVFADPINGMNYVQWVKTKLGITKKPAEIVRYPNGIQIFKYELNITEVASPIDPNLVNSLIFR